MRFIVLIFTFLLLTTLAVAQQKNDTIPDTKTSVIADKVNDGSPVGMDLRAMAKVATVHHYPLPDDVWMYHKELQLTAEQLTQLNSIIKILNLKKAEISQSMRLNESTLEKIFAGRKPDDGLLIFCGNRYGLYEGEMRTAVLNACAQAGKLLTPRQNTKFEQLHKANN